MLVFSSSQRDEDVQIVEDCLDGHALPVIGSHASGAAPRVYIYSNGGLLSLGARTHTIFLCLRSALIAVRTCVVCEEWGTGLTAQTHAMRTFVRSGPCDHFVDRLLTNGPPLDSVHAALIVSCIGRGNPASASTRSPTASRARSSASSRPEWTRRPGSEGTHRPGSEGTRQTRRRSRAFSRAAKSDPRRGRGCSTSSHARSLSSARFVPRPSKSGRRGASVPSAASGSACAARFSPGRGRTTCTRSPSRRPEQRYNSCLRSILI
jgi:hypothetical protein